MIFGIIATLLVAGCVTPSEEVEMEKELAQELEEYPEVTDEGLITVKGNEDVRVVTIKATEKGGNWYFPLEDYEDEFLSVGLHSDSFIKLDSTYMELLDENEAIWLIPMVEDENEGVLFDAIYSREIENCNIFPLKILGKEYELSQLENGSAFENDDKWKVLLEYGDTCVERVVIYLDGYFYDLKDDDQINLFRNDNTILFRFKNLENSPQADIIATKPLEQKKTN